jgi:anthranilate phosphoribosyltransferase
VFVHGTLESAGTTTSAAIFRELDILPCANLRDVSQALESHGIAWVPSALFSPALMQTDALRHRLGFSNCAHAVAAHLDPFQGRGLRLVAAHDATHAEQLAQLLLLRGETALLFEGVEGEAFANPLQRPAIMYFDAGVQHTLFSEETPGTHSAYVQSQRPRAVIGSPTTCHQQLTALAERYQADELMVLTITGDYASRLESYALLAEAFALNTSTQHAAQRLSA